MIHYDQSIKDEAIRRYVNGESSGKIAKEMGINSPDLIYLKAIISPNEK